MFGNEILQKSDEIMVTDANATLTRLPPIIVPGVSTPTFLLSKSGTRSHHEETLYLK